MNNDAKILVTGATGLVGTNLINRLVRNGYTDILASRHVTSPHADGYPDLVQYHKADLTNEEHCDDICSDREVVFHCAAESHGAKVMRNDPMSLVTDNLVMNALMLGSAHRAGVSDFVWISSTTGYQEAGHPILEEEMDMSVHPWGDYRFVGWMKRMTEILGGMYPELVARGYTSDGMRFKVMRPTNIYGPHDDFNLDTGHVLPALIHKATTLCEDEVLEVWGDGKQVRDFIYVDDVVDALIKLAKHEGSLTVNIGLGRGCTIETAAEAILEATNPLAEIRYDRTNPTMIPTRLVNIDRAYGHLDWMPQTTLRQGIEKTVEWFRQQPT